MQTWAIIVDSFRETRDKKLFWVLLGLSTVIALSLACIGFDENGWSLCFGLVKFEDPVMRKGSPEVARMMAFIVSNFLVSLYIGWIGTILCLVGTAGMFPSMMEHGAIEVTLSKPISRFKLFAAKYAGSLIFVLVQSAYFVISTLIVLRWQLGIWLWAFLWAIPLLVLLFSYIYCVCVLAAVWSRSALTALIVGMLFWFVIFSANAFEETYRQIKFTQAQHEGQTEVKLGWEDRNLLGRIPFVLTRVLPKTGDIPYILREEMDVADTDEFMERLLKIERENTPQEKAAFKAEEERIETFDTTISIGSSLAFEIIILTLAFWRFNRKDF